MERLSIANIGGGALVEDVDAALEKVRDDMMVDDPVDGKREVTIKLTFEFSDKQRGVLRTTHAVTVKTPERKHGGVAWLREGGLVTEEMCRESTQMEMPGCHPGNVRMLRDER